jgi:hypothetical protein
VEDNSRSEVRCGIWTKKKAKQQSAKAVINDRSRYANKRGMVDGISYTHGEERERCETRTESAQPPPPHTHKKKISLFLYLSDSAVDGGRGGGEERGYREALLGWRFPRTIDAHCTLGDSFSSC